MNWCELDKNDEIEHGRLTTWKLDHNDQIRNMGMTNQMTWMKFCYFNEIDNMNKIKRDEFGDRNKIDHMDGIWTILLKSIKCM
jgi:hypothetical protein